MYIKLTFKRVRKENRKQAVFKEIIAKNFSNDKKIYIYQTMASGSSGKARPININLKISSYIIVKLLKTKEKEKNLKVVSGKEKIL